MSEQQLQQSCFIWHWNAYPEYRRLLFHIPNGGARNEAEAARLKGMGVVAGIPDLCYVFGGRAHFFELKAAKGKIAEAQGKVAAVFLQQGHTVAMVRDLDSFKAAIMAIHVGQ